MTVSSDSNIAGPYVTNGAKDFAFAFKLYESSELEVYRANSDGTCEVLLTEGPDYTVTINSDYLGGKITSSLVWASGFKVTLRRAVPYTQTDSLSLGRYRPETVERMVDRRAMADAQLHESQSRMLWRPVGDHGVSSALPSAKALAGKVLAFDGNGVPIAGETGDFAATTVLSNTLIGNNAGVPALPSAVSIDALTLLAEDTVFKRSLSERFGVMVDVRDFGAVGDGVTDDTNAIQAAMDSVSNAFDAGLDGESGKFYFDSSVIENKRAAVYFPRGLFKITDEIRVPWGILVTGQNARNHGGTRIKQFGTGASTFSTPMDIW